MADEKAWKSLLPFDVHKPEICEAGQLHHICAGKYSFAMSLSPWIQDGFSVTVTPLATSTQFVVEVALNVDLVARTLIKHYPDERKRIWDEAAKYVETEFQRLEEPNEPRLASDPQGTPPNPVCRYPASCRIPNCTAEHPSVCTVNNCNYPVPVHQEIALVANLPAIQQQFAGKYVLLLRDKCFRDLIFMPCANQKALAHTNVELVQDAESWRVILCFADALANQLHLPLSDCYVNFHVNFGLWESAVAQTRGAKNCHAHVHFFLTKKAALALGDAEPAFKGFLDLPDENHITDCKHLQSQLSCEVGGMVWTRMSALEAEFKTLESKVDAVVDKVDAVVAVVAKVDAVDAKIGQFQQETKAILDRVDAVLKTCQSVCGLISLAWHTLRSPRDSISRLVFCVLEPILPDAKGSF